LPEIIPRRWHIPLPRDAVKALPSAADDGRLTRLAATEPDHMADSLAFLAGYAPGIFDAILTATDPGPADDHPVGDDALEPFCLTCGARAGIFIGRGSDWLHYTGDDRNVQPYDAGHAPVIGWRPAPGIVVVAR
jgi:hypothetical protein